jgi:hypothetical protein
MEYRLTLERRIQSIQHDNIGQGVNLRFDFFPIVAKQDVGGGIYLIENTSYNSNVFQK